MERACTLRLYLCSCTPAVSRRVRWSVGARQRPAADHAHAAVAVCAVEYVPEGQRYGLEWQVALELGRLPLEHSHRGVELLGAHCFRAAGVREGVFA